MKRLIGLLIVIINAGFFSYTCAQPWKLILYEEFEGNTLNYDKWGIGYWWGGVMKDAAEIPQVANAVVSNGTLKLKLEEEPDCYDVWAPGCSACDISVCVSDLPGGPCATEICHQHGDPYAKPPTTWCECHYKRNYQYTAGAIYLKDMVGPYGKFEIRTYIPYFCDMNPAFWLYGDLCNEEIDNFEFDCSDRLSMAVRGRHDCGGPGDAREDDITTCISSGTFVDNWHVWAVEWTPDKIVWLFDGNIMKECASSGPYACNGWYNSLPFFLTNPMHLLAGIAPSFSCTLQCVGPTPLPFTMEVDYIKVWELEEDNYAGNCSTILNGEWDASIMNTTTASGQLEFHAKRSIATNMVVASGADLKLTAGRYIELLPGFETQDGATFFAEIADCETDGEYEIECGICPPQLSGTACPQYKKSPITINDSITVNNETVEISVQEEKFFEKEDGSTLTINPNPTTGPATIWFSPATENAAHSILELTDVTGKMIFHKNNFVPGVVNYINLSALPKGIYFLKISTEDEMKVEKLVLE